MIGERSEFEDTVKNKMYYLKRKIYSLEARLVSLESNNRAVMAKSVGTVWACKIKIFGGSQKKYMDTSPNKTAAIFNVMNKCVEGGESEYDCGESDVKCFNN